MATALDVQTNTTDHLRHNSSLTSDWYHTKPFDQTHYKSIIQVQEKTWRISYLVTMAIISAEQKLKRVMITVWAGLELLCDSTKFPGCIKVDRATVLLRFMSFCTLTAGVAFKQNKMNALVCRRGSETYALMSESSSSACCCIYDMKFTAAVDHLENESECIFILWRKC